MYSTVAMIVSFEPHSATKRTFFYILRVFLLGMQNDDKIRKRGSIGNGSLCIIVFFISLFTEIFKIRYRKFIFHQTAVEF